MQDVYNVFIVHAVFSSIDVDVTGAVSLFRSIYWCACNTCSVFSNSLCIHSLPLVPFSFSLHRTLCPLPMFHTVYVCALVALVQWLFQKLWVFPIPHTTTRYKLRSIFEARKGGYRMTQSQLWIPTMWFWKIVDNQFCNLLFPTNSSMHTSQLCSSLLWYSRRRCDALVDFTHLPLESMTEDCKWHESISCYGFDGDCTSSPLSSWRDCRISLSSRLTSLAVGLFSGSA